MSMQILAHIQRECSIVTLIHNGLTRIMLDVMLDIAIIKVLIALLQGS